MLLLNNDLLPAATLPLPNRGLAFGDGFFETLVFTSGRLHLTSDHHARMQQAAAALYLKLPEALATAEALGATMARLVAANDLTAARLRLQLWRAGGGRYTPLTDTAEWLATAEAFVPDDAPIASIDFAQETHSVYSPLSFCKGPQAWLYVRAAHERQQRGLDEIILCDTSGHVAEAGAAAIFWVKNGVLFTPSLHSGCVAGVRRAQVLRAARAAGVECAEGLFRQAALRAADAVFTANVAAIRCVHRLGEVAFKESLPPFLTAAQTDEQW
ncbi:aminotransferase class IV [Hymenobacter properus]|uniref:branched-chain-amino-acid transaminase n=1 Tax=Hymenobacter properus TaxID=2791026 RepID=A0A931FKZ5_9BACT|nr:aminotransferase class IV [Hymenobacter properus]MBF9140219.1 aminotransferase class IV [Hymenobacter properus]MBR7719026.1 aminotransferase class IV [Microvirga sp. SRT04]